MKTKLIKLTSRIAGIVGAFALLCSGLVRGQATASTYYYMYNGTQVPLNIVSGKMAVRAATTTSDTAQAQRSLAAVASVSTSDTQSLGLPGWSTVNVASSTSSTLRAMASSQSTTTATSAVQSLAASSSVAFAAPVFTVNGSETIPTHEILVGLTAGTTINSVLASLNNPNITASTLVAGTTYKLTTSYKNGLDVLTLANSLNGRPGVAFAEPNFIQCAKNQMIPSDPLFSQAWGLRNSGQSGGTTGFDMAATSAWDITTGSSSVVVVVFDCGVDPAHLDINATTGRDFTDAPVANAGPRPTGNQGSDNHGTWVAGCIAGRANNGIGATGVAPGVRIASARIGIPTSGNSFSSSTSWVVAALDWSRSIGARVTNHSYGWGGSSSAIDAALQAARNAGIVNVASTGNDSAGSIGYPASSAYCLGVGAADRFGSRASFSNYGTGIDFLAPGVDIITTDRVGTMGGNTGDYATVNGTSFASPYAAGVAALIISRNPSWTAAQVEQRMRETCRDMGTSGYDTTNGWGLLNAFRALGGTIAPTDDVGNTISAARTVNLPSSTSAAINYAGDIDMFRLTLSSRQEFTATTTGSTDTWGYLYNANGTEITNNDDANGSANFSIVRVLTAGTYYVGVKHYNGSATSGSYQLVLSSRVPQEPEIRIRGNGYEIVNGDTSPSTTDFTSFGAAFTSNSIDRTFTIDNLGVADLRLIGTPTVAVSGSGASQFSVVANPASTVNVGRPTTFTVRFRPTGAGAFNATLTIASNDYDEGTYSFALTGTGAGTPDDHGNTMSSATVITQYGSRSGNLEQPGDVDMFRFTLGSTVTIALYTSGATDTYGYLYNSTGGLITSNDDGNGYPNFRITRTLAAGTYYLKVAGYSSSTTGAYSLTVAR